MKVFVLKLCFVCLMLIVLYKSTIGSSILHLENKYKNYASKQHIMELQGRLRKGLEKVSHQDRILSQSDAALIHKIVYKVIDEIKGEKAVSSQCHQA